MCQVKISNKKRENVKNIEDLTKEQRYIGKIDVFLLTKNRHDGYNITMLLHSNN